MILVENAVHRALGLDLPPLLKSQGRPRRYVGGVASWKIAKNGELFDLQTSMKHELTMEPPRPGGSSYYGLKWWQFPPLNHVEALATAYNNGEFWKQASKVVDTEQEDASVLLALAHCNGLALWRHVQFQEDQVTVPGLATHLVEKYNRKYLQYYDENHNQLLDHSCAGAGNGKGMMNNMKEENVLGEEGSSNIKVEGFFYNKLALQGTRLARWYSFLMGDSDLKALRILSKKYGIPLREDADWGMALTEWASASESELDQHRDYLIYPSQKFFKEFEDTHYPVVGGRKHAGAGEKTGGNSEDSFCKKKKVKKDYYVIVLEGNGAHWAGYSQVMRYDSNAEGPQLRAYRAKDLTRQEAQNWAKDVAGELLAAILLSTSSSSSSDSECD
ncbi:unnamed protein product [Amoebophrya sp. A25]|nr:unnamed protein product [Amoebophrya sp. A25]|eukprot:GSA25T00010900001.1